MSLLQDIQSNVDSISEADMNRIDQFIFDADDNGTHYHGMNYEQGMRAVLDFLAGHSSAEDIA